MKHVYRSSSTFCLCFTICLLFVFTIMGDVAAQSYPSDRDLFTFPDDVDLYMAYHPESDQAVLLVPAEGTPVIIFEMTPFEQIHQGEIDPSEWQTVDSIVILPGDTAVLRTSAGGLYKLAFTLTSSEGVPRIQVRYAPVPPTLPDPSAPTSVVLHFYEFLDVESGDTMADPTMASVIFCDDGPPPPTPTPDPGVIPEPGTGLLLILGILGLLAAGFLARRNRTACVPACESRRKKGKWWLILLFPSLAVLSVAGAEYLLAQQSCTLFIEKTGNGSGRVIGRGIDCGDVCSISPLEGGQGGVSPGDVLNLKAIPDEGSEFVEWRINDQPYQEIFRMSGDTVLTAVFEPVVTPPVATFSADPVSGVAPLTVVFTNTSTGGVSDFEWNFGDGQTSSAEHPTHVYENAGTYTVSLTVSGPGGSDTLTQPDYIEVLHTNQAPIITITSPEEEAVVASGALQVTGTVSDDGTVVSILVNDVPATVIENTFNAIISFENGNHVITVAAEDDAGAVGLASCMVRVDGEGPMIGIQSPKRGQAVYTLTPEIDISYSDFYAAVDTSSLSVVLVDEHGATTDVTGNLTISDTQAQGTPSTPLADDMKYTLTVSVADTLGNVTQTAMLFYVPIDPASIVPPIVPEGAGWVSGVVYDSTNCNEHLTTCQGLAGARVTVSYAEDPTNTIPGTIITGPDGFFAFPLPETHIYWLRVEKDGYTYGQREVEVVREHSTATDEIYLTPIDPAVTYCDETGCSHTSSDGMLEVEIPAGAIAPGQIVEVTATNFRNVELLPSGGLPPGTWETYAFNLGGDSEVTFVVPITVKIQNYRGFDPGEKIPLGYWNQATQAWEPEGIGLVDETGAWVVMSITHFSNYDCNYTVLVPPEPDPSQSPPENKTPGDGSGPGPCSAPTEACTIDIKSGIFKEDYTLPSVQVLGQEVAPQLLYNSRKANPTEVIDLEFTVNPQAALLDYIGFELYIEGRKTDSFVFSNTPGTAQRYRYLWDGRDVHGKRLPPGVYEFQAKLSVPYHSEYYRAYLFGGKLIPTRPTGISVDATYEYWSRGTIELDSQPDSALGAGWVLVGQQRLYEDEAGRIMISTGERNDEFYFFGKDLLGQQSPIGGDESVIAWVGRDSNIARAMPESLTRAWPPILGNIAVGDQPTDIVLSPDETRAYVANSGNNTVSVIDLSLQQEIATISVGSAPQGLTLSSNGLSAYVINRMADTVSVVDLTAQQVVATINVGSYPHNIALSPDEAFGYVTNSEERTLSVLDLQTYQEIERISVGRGPQDVVVSPDGAFAYTTNNWDGTVSVVDLSSRQEVATIGTDWGPTGIVLSPDGSVAYVANHDSQTVSVLDLIEREEVTTIDVWERPFIGPGSPEDLVLSPDGNVVYVANGSHNNVSVLDLTTEQELVAIDIRGDAYRIELSADGTRAYVTNREDNTIALLNMEVMQNVMLVDAEVPLSSLALSPDGTLAYLTSSENDSLVMADLNTHHPIASIGLGNSPQHTAVSPDGLFAYITSEWSNTVSVVELTTQHVVTTIDVGNAPRGIALSPDGSFACVTNAGSNNLSVLDLQTRQEVARIPVGYEPQDVVLSPDGLVAYTANYADSTVSVVDLSDQQEIATINVGSGPTAIVLSPDGSFAYTTNEYSYTVSIIALLNQQEIGTIDVGNTPMDIVLSPDGLFAYVTNVGANTISVIDMNIPQEVALIHTTEPTGIALAGGSLPDKAYSLTKIDDSWLEYDVNTDTYTRIYPNGPQVHFNSNGSHDYSLDRHGNKTVYTYNPDGTTATMAIVPAGETAPHWTWNFSYQDGKLTEISDPAGRVTTFDIDSNNHLTVITGPDGATRGYAYDSRGLMTHYTDENGHVTKHVYDTHGRITEVIEPPRPVYDPVTGQTSVEQEVLTFTPSDVSYPLINDSPIGDPNSPAPSVTSSGDLVDRVEYGRGEVSGHTDTWGRWLDQTDALNRTTTYVRDEAGNLLQRTYPNGSCDEYTYDGNTNLLSLSHMGAAQCALAPANRDLAQVQTTLYTYEERFDRIKTKTNPLGNLTTYIYDYEEGLGEVGNLIRIEYPQVEDEYGTLVTPTVRYSYNAWGLVETETDARGTVTRYVYTQGTPGEAGTLFVPGVTPVPGLLTQVIKDDGVINQTTTYTDFDGAGNPQTVIGPGCCGGGQEMRYTYDALGRVFTKEDALGLITKHEYDAAGNLVRRIEDYTADGTTGRNVVTDYTYDPHGSLLSQRTEADGIVYESTNGYDINRKLAGQTDSKGNTTNYVYDNADQLAAMTDPSSNTTTYVYTEKGFLDTTTLPNGTEITHVYNAFGQEVQKIVDENGLNLITSYTYDLNGNRLTKIDPEGIVTRYAYDAMNRLISETQDEGGLNLTTTYRYDLNGNVVSTTDPRGVVTRTTYNALGRRTNVRSDAEGLNLETTFDYDQAGNLVSFTDPRGTVTTYEYDAMNRRITMYEDATGLNLITRYTYDRLGNQHFVTDANGIISLTDYNAFGKPVRSVQDVSGIEAETLYVYDNNLNLIAITDDNGNTTQYTYDERNQRDEIHYADGTTVGYTYTPLGNVDTRTNQANEIVDFDYDALERLTGKSYPDGSSQTFTYNASSRLTDTQQTMSGHTTTVSFDYNALGSVQEHVQTIDGLSWTTSYSYDYAAGMATITYPSGTQVVKSLDTLNRLSQVQRDGMPIAGYSYNVTAGTATQTYGNGLSTLVETDALWRVTRLSSAVADYRYSYDNVGNRTSMQRAHKPGAPTDVYQYDNLYQLTGIWYGADATEPGEISAYDALQAYTLDPVGNRLEVEHDGTSVSYLPNDGQNLTNPMHRYEQVDGQTLDYDLKGNLLEDGTNAYTYDIQNQQVGMSGPGGTAEYIYDALGRRVAKIVDGATTYYVYNTFYQVIEERDANNQLLARYTYGAGIDEVLTMERNGSTYTYHRDALGSITEVTDNSGSLIECYEYDVYGIASIFDSSGNPLTVSAIGNPYLFTARRYDPESGNYYYRARMYSPALGRFLQMDPLGYVDGLNLYMYARNNTLIYSDPWGLKSIDHKKVIQGILKNPEDDRFCTKLYEAVRGYLTSWEINAKTNIGYYESALQNALERALAIDNTSLVPLINILTNLAWAASPGAGFSIPIVATGTLYATLTEKYEKIASEKMLSEGKAVVNEIMDAMKQDPLPEIIVEIHVMHIQCSPKKAEICEDLTQLANGIVEKAPPVPELLSSDELQKIQDKFLGDLLMGMAKERGVPLRFRNGSWELTTAFDSTWWTPPELTAGNIIVDQMLFGSYTDELNKIGYQP